MVKLAGDGTGDLQVQANVLNGYVNQALAAGSGPVTVIGYSAGGVVAWLWDVDYDGVAKARRIITLGSPLHGADLAAVGATDLPGACPAACEELVPGSSMLDRLQGTASATRPPWLSLWTTDDQVVQPPDSARLPGAVNVPLQSICPGVSIGHGQLPTAPLVVGIVLRTLQQHRPQPAPALRLPFSAGPRRFRTHSPRPWYNTLSVSVRQMGKSPVQKPCRPPRYHSWPIEVSMRAIDFLRTISLTNVGLVVMLIAGCGASSGPPKPSGLEKTNLTVGAVPVADEAGLYIA